MTWNFNMNEAPKDQPILAWCDNSICSCARGEGRLCLHHAHAEGLSQAEDGPHIVEWGGSFVDTGEYGEVLAELPDWWFRWDSEWEVAANPIAWQPIEPISASTLSWVRQTGELPENMPEPTPVPHLPWLTEDDVP